MKAILRYIDRRGFDCVLLLVAMAIAALVMGACNRVRAEGPQIMPADELEQLRQILPRVADAEVQAVLEDPTTIFYDDKSLPPAYLLGGGSRGNQSPLRPADIFKNASNDGPGTEEDKGDGKGGNANIDSPWKNVAGGTSHCPNVISVKFQWLPKQRDGRPWPVVYTRRIYPHLFDPGDRTAGISFTNPKGAIYGELLIQILPDGSNVPFELRLRERLINDTDTRVFEPFGTPANMAAAIKRLRPDWSRNAFLIAAVRDLQSNDKQLPADKFEKAFPGPTYARTVRTANGRNAQQLTPGDDVLAVRLPGNVDRLLPLNDDDLVAELCMTTVWQETTDSEWRVGCAMPTATVPADDEIAAAYAGMIQLGMIDRGDVISASFANVKPPRYAGPFLAKNKIDCRNCHKHTGLSARSFDQGRGWYGVVRGFDEIISWHPFTPSYYVGNVRPDVGADPNTNWIPPMREEWIKAGIVARFDSAKHPSNPQDPDGSMYLRLRSDR